MDRPGQLLLRAAPPTAGASDGRAGALSATASEPSDTRACGSKAMRCSTAGAYDRNLALARLGVLPFFVMGTLAVVFWARHPFGRPAALVATLLFTTLPPVLAHAGIATTDMAVTCRLALALCCRTGGWSRRRSGRGILLGVAVAGAVLSKFSALLFLPAARGGHRAGPLARRGTIQEPHRPDAGRRLRVAYVAALVTVWAGYRFAVGPLVTEADFRSRRPGRRARSAARTAPLTARIGARLPCPGVLRRVGHLAAKNRAGHKSYLLGEVRDTGWWYFFPVALAVKTPLAVPAALRRGRGRRLPVPRPVATGDAAGAAGDRHRDPAGVPPQPDQHRPAPCAPDLSVSGHHRRPGARCPAALRRGAPAGPAVRHACCWAGTSCRLPAPIRTTSPTSTSWPADHPERILVDSDLDNGQDLKRLADTLRARGIKAVSLAYAGSATVAEHGLPPVRGWSRTGRSKAGWRRASTLSSWDHWIDRAR